MRFLVGTAGHIDHGKTSLVRALTGIDTDRLKEEKARGITIELGFAHLALPDGQTVGVVDVPGHERFVRTMVAGATGIDLVLFVVAADEGVMPQTREHLHICVLLGITRGLIILTKIDLVNDELRALAEADLAEAVRGSCLQDAPVLPCSTATGQGLDAIPAAIAAALEGQASRDEGALFRLPIDRVFTLRGHGTVVTGTTVGGSVAALDAVVALPGGTPTRVRSIEVHGASVARAGAGQRTALNLPIARDAVERGQVLVHEGTLLAGDRLDVTLRWLPNNPRPLPRRARLLFHHGTTQCQVMVNLLDGSDIAPGKAGLAQLLLDRPIVALPGDRFVLRGFRRAADHSTTVGGGTILRTLGARHRRATPEIAQQLAAFRDAPPDERVRLEVERAGRRGLDAAALQMRLPSSITPRLLSAALQRLLTARTVIRYSREPTAYVGATALAAIGDELVAALQRWHTERPLVPTMPRESLRAIVDEPRLLAVALEPLVASGRVIATGDGLRLREHDVDAAASARGVDTLAERVAAALETAALQPPRAAELSAQLGVAESALQAALVRLVREQRAIKIGDFHFAAAAVTALRERLIAKLSSQPEVTPAEWKDLVGASRKFAIPLAEYFDATRVTLRVGDNRRLRRV